MYVDMGWAESDFEEMVVGYAIFYGGLGQTLVAIFELIKGSTFSFAVFGSFGAFWLGWGLVVLENNRNTSDFTGDYTDGKTFYLIQWGVLTFCFWLVALRKNICLITVLGLLATTFFLLAAATQSGKSGVKNAAGAVGFCTAIAAWYTAMAEIINEDYGRHVLPGLQPLLTPEREEITKEGIINRTQYDIKTNTIFLQFRGLQIMTPQDVTAIREGLEEAFDAAKSPNGKVHVVVDYENVLISDDVFQEYWEMVGELERTYYLSAKRFHVTSFGTKAPSAGGEATNMRKVADNWTRADSSPLAPPRSSRSLKAEGAPSSSDKDV
jgi:succinate-acetate transporter protein